MILKQVQFYNYRPKKDKSCSLTFITDLEVSSEDIKQFHESLDQRGIIYFSEKGELTQSEIEEIDKTEIEIQGKTKAQRLRGVLYCVWSKMDHPKYSLYEDFKDFYALKMEEIIEHYKDKLDD